MSPGGVLTALVTPYDEAGEVATDVLARHVDRLAEAGVDGFFACGTTGEGACLSADEKRRVVTTVQERAGDRDVVAAVIQPDTRSALAECRMYADLGVRYVAAVAPYYVRVDERELVDHFTALAEASTVPLLLYDIPGNTGNPITEAVMRAMLPHPNVIGVKDSTGDFSRFLRLVIEDSVEGANSTRWIQGEDTLDVVALLAGAAGVVSGLSNVLPQAFVRLLRAVRSGDTATALAMQHVINALHALVRSTAKGVPAIRVALSQMGLGTRFLRSREFSLGTDLDGAVRDAVESATRLYERYS